VYRLAREEPESWVPADWWLALCPLVSVGTLLVGVLVAVALRNFGLVAHFVIPASAIYAASAGLMGVTLVLVLFTRYRGTGEFLLTTALAALVCATVISWGAELLGVAPFKVLSVAITLNNFVLAAVLGPPLLRALYPRVRQWGLLYWQTLERERTAPSYRVTIGALLCWLGAGGALVIGLGVPAGEAASMAIVVKVAPAIAVILLGVLMI